MDRDCGEVELIRKRARANRAAPNRAEVALAAENRKLREQNEALKSAVAEAEQERFFLNALLEDLPDQIYFKDRASRFLKISNTQAVKFGVSSPAEAIGKSDSDFFSEEHARPARENEQSIIRTGEPLVDIEEKETWEDGREAWVSTTKMPLRDEKGKIIGTYGISRDITLEKRQRAEIARQNNLLNTLLETTPEDIYFKDAESRFVSVSRSLMKRLGASSEEEILGKTDFDFFDAEHARATRVEELDVMKSGIPRIAEEVRELRPDGSEHWVLTTKMPLRDADGRAIGTFGINRDISELKRLEAELRQSQKMEAVGRLAGGISHDFNNLLMAISGYAELLSDTLNEDPEAIAQLDGIIQASAQASRLTAQLLTYGQPRTAKTELVDTGAVVGEMRETLLRLIGEDIRIEIDLTDECTCVRVDPAQLEQVVLNLCLNARDAMPGGGTLTITTRLEQADGDHPLVILSVADTGEGFDPDAKELLFEPYFTTKARGKGTGLGLATVYAVVKHCGGTIEVESAPGQGACFRISLPHARVPCVLNTSAGATQSSDSTSGESSETILLAEDEEAVRELVRDSLVAAGYSVVTAASGEEALMLGEDLDFDLLLADIVMPGMDGVQLADTLISRKPQIAVLLMSGYTDERLEAHGVGEKPWPLIEKPFRLSELQAAVRAALDEAARISQPRP
ncbi:MAG TPA: PAS domain-containing protein [Gaiellaceae bacterium]